MSDDLAEDRPTAKASGPSDTTTNVVIIVTCVFVGLCVVSGVAVVGLMVAINMIGSNANQTFQSVSTTLSST